MDLATLRRIAGRAVQAGGTIHSKHLVEWDISGRCRSSVVRELTARSEIPRGQKDQRSWNSDAPDASIFRVILHTRCRKCDMCLKHRGRHWASLAQRELLQASRTWFVTLTLSPGNHFMMWARAKARLIKRGTKLEDLTSVEIFRERDAEIYPHIQLMFKRLRKAGSSFRYLVVGEMHTDKLNGYPHYHLFIHEIAGKRPVKYDDIEANWDLGFFNAKLVDILRPGSHWYVTKYLTKEASTRVRASFRYGAGPTPERHNDKSLEGVRGNHVAESNMVSPHKEETNDLHVEGTTAPLFHLRTFGSSVIAYDVGHTLDTD